MPGQLKTVSFMKPVVGERFGQDLRAREHCREGEQVFVGLNFYCLRNGSDPSENCGAYRHPARSQKSAAPAKQKRAVNRISLKMKSFAKNLGSLTTVALNVDNAVAHNSNGRIDRKSTRLNSSHSQISYAVFCLKKKKTNNGNDGAD